MFFIFSLLIACTIKQKGFVTHVTGVDNQCAYVAIRKERTEGKDHKYLAPKDSVFLCCPNKDGIPMCKKAIFIGVKIPETKSSFLNLN